MSFPNYPNPAQRAQLFQAHLLRQQGLTYRQIAERMDRAVSTVHSYLHAFEQFRTDLIADLAADQLVTHLIQLADLDDPHHDQRLTDIRELRLLLGSLPGIRRDESERTADILRSGVVVDRYGQRFPKPERLHPATPEEEAQIEQLTQLEPPQAQPEPDQPLALVPSPPLRGEMPKAEGGERPDSTRTEPNTPEQDLRPPPMGEVSRSDGGGRPQSPASDAPRSDAGPRAPDVVSGTAAASPPTTPAERPKPTRTEPNKPEQETPSTPAHNGKSPKFDQNSPTLNRAERRRRQRSTPKRRKAKAA